MECDLVRPRVCEHISALDQGELPQGTMGEGLFNLARFLAGLSGEVWGLRGSFVLGRRALDCLIALFAAAFGLHCAAGGRQPPLSGTVGCLSTRTGVATVLRGIANVKELAPIRGAVDTGTLDALQCRPRGEFWRTPIGAIFAHASLPHRSRSPRLGVQPPTASCFPSLLRLKVSQRFVADA